MATRSNELDATGASDPRSWLFVKKPMNMLLAEAGEAGQHSLKRTLGAGQLTALGVGAIIGWDLTLEYAMGASTVSSGWSNHFIELLNIFHIKMPLWLAYDHWTGLNTATKIIARQMARASDATL